MPSESSWPGIIERYREFLSVTEATPVITLREGNTPLLPAPDGLVPAFQSHAFGRQGFQPQEMYFTRQMKNHHGGLILLDGYLYGADEGTLTCLDYKTGKVMWTQPNLTRSSLLMVDGHFVCLAEEGMLYLLKVNPKRFEVVSRVELRDPGTDRPLLEFPCWAAPVLAHGLLYVRSEGRLVCLELIPPKKQ